MKDQGINIAARPRRTDLDAAKGLGILLVVIGHIVARNPPAGNEWYVILKNAIYLFHMPFFMYLSGYVTFLSGHASAPLGTWPDLLRKRAQRLLLPFLIFGLIIVAGKLVAGRFMFVDNLPTSGMTALVNFVWNTDSSPATSVWYVVTLFGMCALTPLLLHLLNNNLLLLAAVALGLFIFSLPHVMYLDRLARYYVFFVAGGIAASHDDIWNRLTNNMVWLWCVIFLGAIGLCLLTGKTLFYSPALLVCGLLSMPSIHGLVRNSSLSTSTTLLTLGKYSFVIYLLNTPCIGLIKGIGTKFVSWDYSHFFYYAPILTLAGIIGPIVIKEWLLIKFPPLYKITN